MEPRNLKKTPIIILIMIVSLNSSPGKSQTIVKPAISLKLINYRKTYKITDTIRLSVENVSAKPLCYVIGVEIYDRNNWIQIVPDIKYAHILEDIPAELKILIPHKTKIIKYNGVNKNFKPQKEHGVTKRTRFYLYYQALNSPFGENMKKLVSREYVKTW